MPPNGWGCRCTVRSLSARQMRRDKLDTGQAPPLEESERISTTTGEVFGNAPKGIDTGWNYNVGKAWLGPEIAFGKKAIPLPDNIRSTVIGDTALFSQVFAKPFKVWATNVIKRNSNRGEIRAVGYMNHKTITHATTKGVVIEDATITISDDRLRRMLKPKSRRSGKALVPNSVLLKLPAHIAKPKAILWDKTENAVVYIFDIKGQPARSSKLFVSLNFRKKSEISNSIRSAGVSSITNLKDKNHYELIDGKL